MGGQPYFFYEKVFLRNTLLRMYRLAHIIPSKLFVAKEGRLVVSPPLTTYHKSIIIWRSVPTPQDVLV